MTTDNPNCDGSGPHAPNPEVRVLPIGKDSNAILCFACFNRELIWRRTAVKHGRQFDLLAWKSLKIYGEASKPYQPKTGQPCHCNSGQARDNCPSCEGTGMKIDFAAIRACNSNHQ